MTIDMVGHIVLRNRVVMQGNDNIKSWGWGYQHGVDKRKNDRNAVVITIKALNVTCSCHIPYPNPIKDNAGHSSSI